MGVHSGIPLICWCLLFYASPPVHYGLEYIIHVLVYMNKPEYTHKHFVGEILKIRLGIYTST